MLSFPEVSKSVPVLRFCELSPILRWDVVFHLSLSHFCFCSKPSPIFLDAFPIKLTGPPSCALVISGYWFVIDPLPGVSGHVCLVSLGKILSLHSSWTGSLQGAWLSCHGRPCYIFSIINCVFTQYSVTF